MSDAAQTQIADSGFSPVPLTLENEYLRLAIYPGLGAKIGSLLALSERHELLQQPLLPYRPRTSTMAFEEGDASGYDECIPSVSGCQIETAKGALSIPDHGDFWRIPFEVLEQDGGSVRMAATGFSLPLRLEKTIRLSGEQITLSYKLTNVGRSPVEYLWSAHPGFAVEPGDRIELPASVETVMVQGSGGGRLGSEGTRHGWPLTTTDRGDATDLSLVGRAEEHVGDKLFALAPPEGWCALKRLAIRRRIEMRFDPLAAPYFGLWICYNGWPEARPAKQFCVAMEPCTAPTDSLAAAINLGLGRTLEPECSSEWQVEVRITQH